MLPAFRAEGPASHLRVPMRAGYLSVVGLWAFHDLAQKLWPLEGEGRGGGKWPTVLPRGHCGCYKLSLFGFDARMSLPRPLSRVLCLASPAREPQPPACLVDGIHCVLLHSGRLGALSCGRHPRSCRNA